MKSPFGWLDVGDVRRKRILVFQLILSYEAPITRHCVENANRKTMTIKQLYEKYDEMGKKFETVYISQVKQDVYQALSHQRMLRTPKDER